MQVSIINIISVYASLYNVDPSIVRSIVEYESSGNPVATGKAGEVGLMQVMPEYSRFTIKELKDPTINIIEGINFIKQAKEKCKHKVDKTWLVCYNRGIVGGARVKDPKQDKYYKDVMNIYYKRISQ